MSLYVFGGLVGVWLTLPTLIVVPLSLTDRRSFQFPPQGWSLEWYRRFFDPESGWMDATFASVRIALLSAAVATVVGTSAALALHRWHRRKAAGAVRALLLLPLVVPGIIVAIGVYALVLELGLLGTTIGFVTAHATIGLPFVIVTVGASLRNLDPQLERAAASLGAGPFETARRVTLPLIAPGIASGALFAFMASFDEVVVALFIKSPFLETLPVQMFASMTRDTEPTVAAAATLILALTTTVLVAAGLVTGRRGRTHTSEEA
ncbi:ABC transporter permease [Nocardioides sp.]|uniref:ABC transporter permease n=1 Tax=Nocardioides sp. TaxID=35761 RepID=UPI0037849BAA